MVNMLSPLQPGSDNPVIFIEGFLVKRDSFPGFGKKRFVFILSRSTAIDVANIWAALQRFLITTVANERCFQKLGARFICSCVAVAVVSAVVFDFL